MIIRIFAASVLAKPLNNAQIVRGVFVYTHLHMANLIPFTKRLESSENLINLLESQNFKSHFIQVTFENLYTSLLHKKHLFSIKISAVEIPKAFRYHPEGIP